jgi:hypothetical protein
MRYPSPGASPRSKDVVSSCGDADMARQPNVPAEPVRGEALRYLAGLPFGPPAIAHNPEREWRDSALLERQRA